ncbi:MAG: phosphoribosylanthranilate isomerase [Deltaproteobacteria bacterium]|nr:phosphoribosylanthranilate isomerase [Deltaproteobacteria bacterium]
MRNCDHPSALRNNRAPHGLPWPPRIQVAGVSSLEEALFCASVGVDALGLTLELPTGIHDGLDRATARRIIEALPSVVLPVVITYLDTAQDAAALVQEVRGQAIQFHGGITPKELERFRSAVPAVKTIGRVTVIDRSSVDMVGLFLPPLWDAVILDSYDPATGRLGATGVTHDWAVSALIVKVAKAPVILAGGLTPENVAQAILTVRPAGVDAHSGVENEDGSRNFDRIKAFAQAANEAFRQIH